MPRPRKSSNPPPRAPAPRPRVSLHAHGLELQSPRPGAPPGALRGGEVVPLLVGSMHYWRHRPSEWGAGLDALVDLGFRMVDTYVPWGIHETEPGVFDFGERFAHLDVARFLRMADERGLLAVVRPGPHINAELTYFGLPERIVWDRACQARTSRGNPVMLPIVPVAFPVPSYASETFHLEAAAWLRACATLLAPHRWPEGPMVLLQVDNEGALYFRDGPYDQDYHPDALRLYRTFLKDKYKSLKSLREAYGDAQVTYANVEPPHRFDAKTADDLPRHMDWMELHEHLLATAMDRLGRVMKEGGLDGIPTLHNFPLGEAATPLNAGRMADAVDLVGLDYYHRATPHEHWTLLRRTSELATRCAGRRHPPYGAEVGAGFPPFFEPIDEADSLYTLMAALAYGLRGYNLYMVVERDRWVGAPVDPHGQRRPFADAYEALNKALERTAFHTLRRAAPVRLVTPRALRRLARATHAFGPATPALFNILGAGYRESCLEDDLGLGEVTTLTAESYLRAFERALTARGVPFAYVGGETLEVGLEGARWAVCVTAGGVKAEVFARLRAVQRAGAKITVGPRLPERDGSFRPLGEPHDARGLEIEPLDDVAQADALVARRIDELKLPTYPVAGTDIFVCVHEDEGGVPRVAFVMNPTAGDVVTQVSLPGAAALTDCLDRDASPIVRKAGAFELTVRARTVRMFEIEVGATSASVRAPASRPPASRPPH